MGEQDTRDLAVTAISEIRSHIVSCERRYEEGNQRMERLTTFIKDAHDKTTTAIADIQATLSEQRGAGKMGKLIAAGVSGTIGAAAAVIGMKVLK